MRNKQKIFVAIMIATWVLPFLTAFCFFHIQKKMLRREVKQIILRGIDPNALVTLRFSKISAQKELNWEHAHEFCFRGQMFDVVQTQVSGDSIIYTCWEDHAETALNQQIRQYLAAMFGNHPQHQEHQKRWITWLKTPCLLAQVPFLDIKKKYFGLLSPIFYGVPSYANGLPEPCTPPPR